jgi:hypothetical protein
MQNKDLIDSILNEYFKTYTEPTKKKKTDLIYECERITYEIYNDAVFRYISQDFQNDNVELFVSLLQKNIKQRLITLYPDKFKETASYSYKIEKEIEEIQKLEGDRYE